MRKNIYIIMLAVITALASCSDWLDIQPSDRITEENNYSSVSGFEKALNGIYVELNQSSIYGKELTSGFIEVLAQRYAVADVNKVVKEYMNFKYAGTETKGIISSIWSKEYSLIANVNCLLQNCDKRRDVLSEREYNLIKGEALALRAFLHLDLFRLFGPVYNPEKSTISIPYYTVYSLDVSPKLSSVDYMKKLEEDLLAAEALLEKSDPVIQYGISGDPQDDFWQARNLRLNYYALQGLMARAYYYMQNDKEAYNHAMKVIEAQEKNFPWITPMKISNSNPDRVFSSEIMFSAQNLERNSIFSANFDGNNLKPNTLLAPRTDVVNYIFDNEKVDYRYIAWLKNSTEISGTTYSIFNKYQSQSSDSLYNQMIPLIKVSEAYLIATECSEDYYESLKIYNTLRNHRGLLSKATMYQNDIDAEWIREFWGEGQLFFYYKRNNLQTIKDATSQYGTRTVTENNYVLPLPDGETKYN